MSSNQWEVVTKSKKQKNLDRKVEAHTEQKRVAAIKPKLEEIIPSYQYRNLISGKGAPTSSSWGKENSPAKSTSSSTKSKSPKKQVKTVTKEAKKPSQQKDKAKVPAKPKSLESALRNLTTDDFLATLEQLKLTYPGSELLWLKGIAGYFNSNLLFDCDPTFAGKSTNYPSNLVPLPLKKSVINFLETVGEANVAYFYHTVLNGMAVELSKNLPIIGYKFMLQLIGQNWPQICSNNMARTAMLCNSYQNRSPVFLSILWAIGQCGQQNLMEGIKVWQNLMLPHLEMKSYSKYITDYIERILNIAVNQSLNLNQNEFFVTYNALKTSGTSMPREQQESLERSCELFLQKYIANSTKQANLFLTLLRDIEDAEKNRIELNGCISCLIRGTADSFKVWKMNYKKQVLPTVLLLQKIDNEWYDRAVLLAHSTALRDFLGEAKLLNNELDQAKRRDPFLDELIAVVTSVSEKSSSALQKKRQSSEQKKKCGCCKWTLGSLFVIALIAGSLYYDTEVNGKGVFAKSATGKVLQNAGLLPHVERIWYTTMSASARGYKWAEKTVPPYARPVGKLACDLYKIGRNAACNAVTVARDLINAKLPIAAKFLEQYVPGLPKKIEDTSVAVKNVVVDIYGKTVSCVQTNVLVGRFSTENLGKSLNQTRNVVLEYYYNFHKKVDAYAKLK